MAHALQIGIESTFGHIMCMADIASLHWFFTAYFTYFCHSVFSLCLKPLLNAYHFNLTLFFDLKSGFLHQIKAPVKLFLFLPAFSLPSDDRSGFKTPSKAQWLRCPAKRDSHLIFKIKVQHSPPINAHILAHHVCCAFSIGLRLALEPDLRFWNHFYSDSSLAMEASHLAMYSSAIWWYPTSE